MHVDLMSTTAAPVVTNDAFLDVDHGHPIKTSTRAFHGLPTRAIVNELATHGYHPTKVLAPRAGNRAGNYGRHMLRLRHQDAKPIGRLGDTVPEIVVVNANDGTSSIRLLAGLFRLVCSNGLILSTGTIGAIRIGHASPNVRNGSLWDAINQLAIATANAGETIDTWSGTMLTYDDQLSLAAQAMTLRGISEDSPFRPEQMLHARRTSDRGNDLWHIFNTVQENLSTPGVSAVRMLPTGARRTSIRGIRGASSTLSFNQRLWTLASTYAPANVPTWTTVTA